MGLRVGAKRFTNAISVLVPRTGKRALRFLRQVRRGKAWPRRTAPHEYSPCLEIMRLARRFLRVQLGGFLVARVQVSRRPSERRLV